MSHARRPHPLNFDTFDDRIVPAVVDLTARGAELPAGDAIVRQTDAQPTGTGHIQSFVRLQGAASGGGSEQGYNTTARPLQFDENKSPSFTRELTVGAVPLRTVGTTEYREFLLDVNQKSSASKLSLDEVQVFLADRPDLTGYKAADPDAGGQPTLGGKTPVFRLDSAANDVTVVLDARLNNGSGSGDMFLLVPEASFAGAQAGTYVYLYSKFGGQAGATANGGFEEWAVRPDGGGAPVSGTGSLGGIVYWDADGMDENGQPGLGLSAGDQRLMDVAVELRGTEDGTGRTVTLATRTNANGEYKFENLKPGTYTLIEHQPEGYLDGKNSVGSAGGQIDAGAYDRMIDIFLAAGIHGWGYNFGEVYDNGGE